MASPMPSALLIPFRVGIACVTGETATQPPIAPL
jgi:hypothetical protein